MIRLLLLLITILTLNIVSYGQDANVMIQVNGELLVSGLVNPQITFNSDRRIKARGVNYVAGKFTIGDKGWQIIKKDSSLTFNFQFDYYTYKRNKTDIKTFEVKLSKRLLENEYLIINIYDFRNRKYRKWYGRYTDEDYLVELTYPNGPMYIRYK